MKTQHTPGPWATSRDAVPEWHTQITVYEEATGKRVATVFETPANARLIKVAPEMAAFTRKVADMGRLSYSNLKAADFTALVDEARSILSSLHP